MLAPRPVSLIWGVGAVLERRLARDGIATIGDLQNIDESRLTERYGSIGTRLLKIWFVPGTPNG